jgi:ribosomal protein S18 acetylase RimI-like enzyme
MQKVEQHFGLQTDGFDVVIERPHPGDGEGILRVHQEAFVQGYTRPDGKYGASKEAFKDFVHGEFEDRRRKYWDEETRRDKTGLWVARLVCNNVVDKIVGYGECQDGEDENVVQVNGMYVDPEWQRRGIGTFLLRTSLSDFEQPTALLDVTQWANATKFYAKFGFYITHNLVLPPSPPAAFGITLLQYQMRLDREGETDEV